MSISKSTFSVNEAASYSGIGRNNLRILIGWGKIPVIKIGNKIIIRKDTLDKFLEMNEGKNLKNKFEVIEI